jgi:RNA polymerase sigma factor (sigma-70 family)
VEASALAKPAGLNRRRSLVGPLLRLRSDEQLLALFRAGQDEAFGALHDRYRPRLVAYARQMLGATQADAEDVLQDVFVRAYDALRADARPIAVRAWLYRVAHNRCVDQLRRPAPAQVDIFDVNRGPESDPAKTTQQREDLRTLVADVQRLPDQQRSALLMRELEGLSYQELSGALGVTVPAVKSLLVRARVGLVEAGEARDTACADIRHDLAAAHDRGVRSSGRARRHLRECSSCRDYRRALRAVDRRLNAVNPGGGPLATLAKLLGLGGAGSGAAAGATIAGGGSATTVGGGMVGACATKLAAVVAAAAVVGGSAATVETVKQVQDQRSHRSAPAPSARPDRAAALPLTAPAGRLVRELRLRIADRPSGGERSGAHPHPAATALATTEHKPLVATAAQEQPSAVEVSTGGVQAPDEPAADAPPTTGTSAAGAPAGTTATPAVPDATPTADAAPATGAPSATGAAPAGAPTVSAAAVTPAAGGASTSSATTEAAFGEAAAPGTAPSAAR